MLENLGIHWDKFGISWESFWMILGYFSLKSRKMSFENASQNPLLFFLAFWSLPDRPRTLKSFKNNLRYYKNEVPPNSKKSYSGSAFRSILEPFRAPLGHFFSLFERSSESLKFHVFLLPAWERNSLQKASQNGVILFTF